MIRIELELDLYKLDKSKKYRLQRWHEIFVLAKRL